MKNFAIIIFILSALQVKAQPPYLSDNGRFTVDQKSGCAPFTVRVTALECDGAVGSPSCTLISGNGISQSLTTQTTIIPYNDAGNFTLKIIFGSDPHELLDIQVFPNIQPTFEMYACEGNKVSVKITDTNYDQYIINYDDGNSATISSLAKDDHTFVVPPASRTVSVRGENTDSAPNCSPQVQTIDVTPNLQPAFISELEVLSASKIKLEYNTSPVSNEVNTQYRLYIATNYNGGPNFQNGPSISKTTTTITVPNTDDNFYCFKMNAIDACTNLEVNLPNFSNIICSADFDLDIQSEVNKLTWTTYSLGGSNVTDFSITKTPGTPIAKLPSDPFHDDTDITCNIKYCYQLITNYNNAGKLSKSISIENCRKSFSSDIPSAIEDISSIVSETGSALTWLQDPAFTPAEYTIIKSTNGNYSFLAKTTTQTYADASYLTESNSCYKISYTDACLNASPLSNEACPIQLTGLLMADNNITLSWSPYNTGWKNGVRDYTVQKFTAQGQLLETYNNISTTNFPDPNAPQDFANQTYVYVVTANANDVGVSESISNAFVITKEPYLTYPTAFSPRGNILDNQIFKVFGQYVSSFELRIFNRWGQEMFYTNDFDIGWDGTYNGGLMPEGTYVFTAKITDQEGRTFDRSGTVVLLLKR